MEPIEVGNKVRNLMKTHNYTMKRLADEMGINIKTVSKKSVGKQEFYASEIIMITNIFELDIKKCVEIFFNNSKTK